MPMDGGKGGGRWVFGCLFLFVGVFAQLHHALYPRDPSTFSEGDWRHSEGTWIPRDIKLLLAVLQLLC